MSGHGNVVIHLSVTIPPRMSKVANQPRPPKAPLLSSAFNISRFEVVCGFWCVYTTSITASLNLTSCKIFILGTFGTIIDLRHVVEWTLAEGTHLWTNGFTRLLLYKHSLAFKVDCDVTGGQAESFVFSSMDFLMRILWMTEDAVRSSYVESVHLLLNWNEKNCMIHVLVQYCTYGWRFVGFWSVHGHGIRIWQRHMPSSTGPLSSYERNYLS